MCSSANKTALGISGCLMYGFNFLSLIPESLICNVPHYIKRKRSPWNVKEDINRLSLEGERLNKRWKVKKSGGV